MKLNLYLLGIALLASSASGQDGESIGNRKIEMRPNEKRALTLKPSERNPYAKRTVAKDVNQDEEQNAEEIAIRNKIRALEISGSSRSNSGLRLLMGDILIENGMVLPQLIINQTQFLKVVEVTNDKVELGWLDVETGELTGKTMRISYDLGPSVAYVLQGQVGASGSDGLQREQQMGVLRPRRNKNAAKR